METLANLMMGFGVALTPDTLFLAFCGCFFGTIVGALLGRGPSNGGAILIPLAFGLGLDNATGLPRFTGGTLHQLGGVDFLLAIVGFFAISEIFIFIESLGKNSAVVPAQTGEKPVVSHDPMMDAD